MDPNGGLAKPAQASPHPLRFYTTPSPDRDPSNSLCLGCKIADGRAVGLNDYALESSQQLVGEASGRAIYQIELSFDVKKGSVAERMRHEWDERSGDSSQDLARQHPRGRVG